MYRPSFRVGKVRVLVSEAAPADGQPHEGEDRVPATSIHRKWLGRAVSGRGGIADGGLRMDEEEVGPSAGEAGSDEGTDEGYLGMISG